MVKTINRSMLLIHFNKPTKQYEEKGPKTAPISNSRTRFLKMSQDFPFRLLLSWEVLFNEYWGIIPSTNIAGAEAFRKYDHSD